MTVKLFSRALRHKPVQAAITLVVGLGLSTAALATELKPPSGKSKLLRDKDVTVIVIDKNDNKSSSRIGTSSKSKSPLKQPSTNIGRDDDTVEIRIKRDNTRGGTIVRSGPKVIIVDENTRGCGDSSGVCVIRP